MNNGGKSSIGFDDPFVKAEFLLLLFTTFEKNITNVEFDVLGNRWFCWM